MQKSRLIIVMLAMVMLGTAVLIAVVQPVKENAPLFSVRILSEEKTEQIDCWIDNVGNCYVFLPSYVVDLSKIELILSTDMSLRLNGRQLDDGYACKDLQLNVPYELCYDSFYKTRKCTLIFMQSANVSTMYIETSSESMDYIHAQKGNEETGTLSLFTHDGILNYEDNQISINGRGNATWTDSDKKSYSIKLFSEAGLLGMGKAQKWILLANGLDSSNLRNKIVYEFAENMGFAYSPDSKWVDLYLNGEYAGLYLLCERNEVHPERVNISTTNSFLVSSDLENRLNLQGYPYLLTGTELALRIHYPTDVTNEVMMDLSQKWQSIENAILSEKGIDLVTGKTWLELIDLDSWARKYLIDEIFGNLDACLISQYFYFDGDDASGKVYAGPIWDYDASMGNRVTWQLFNPRAIFAGRSKFKPGLDTTLIYTLSQKEEFYKRVVELYESEFLPELESLIAKDIYAYAEEIEKSSAMNQIRWSITEDVFFHQDYIIKFLSDRNMFLHSMWVDGVVYHQVQIDQGVGTIYAHFAVPSGECLTELPEYQDTEYSHFLGTWHYSETDEPFNINQPITEDIEIYAKWVDKSSKLYGRIGKILPLGIIAVMGVVILTENIKRMKKSK